MLRTLCKSKITKIFVTGKNLRYNGSIGLDEDILEASDILPGEQVQVLNINNGERLTTYAITEERSSGKVVLYGPAARKCETGDELVILSYCVLENEECKAHRLGVVALSDGNRLEGK